MITYLRLRRMGVKRSHAAALSGLDKLTRKLLDGAVVIAGLIVLLWVHSWMLERDIAEAEKAAQQSSAEAERAWATVAHLLNGYPVKVDERTALFIEVHEERDLCSAC